MAVATFLEKYDLSGKIARQELIQKDELLAA